MIKAQLIVEVQKALGIGRPAATRIVTAVFDSMLAAVKRGEVVETPFGTLRRIRIRARQRLTRAGGLGKLKLVGGKPHWRNIFRPFPEYRDNNAD